MAALVGRDRVTATYPGFQKTEGDISALAANGPDRPISGGSGQSDAIIIRKVATLTAADAASFDQFAAQQLATKSAHRMAYDTVKTEGFENPKTFHVCGNPGYAFTRLEHNSLQHAPRPGFSNAPMTWTNLDTYVLMLVGRDVWQAEYERAYEPGLERKAAALIQFTANFCVQLR
jgi:hypothetical protein